MVIINVDKNRSGLRILGNIFIRVQGGGKIWKYEI